MFGLLSDASDPAGSRFTPHRDKGEGHLTDAQVLLEHPPSPAGAHRLHPFQIVRVDEGLRGSVTASVVPDVGLPLVLGQRVGRARADVAFEEGPEAVVPFGRLAGSLIFRLDFMTQQDTKSQRQKQSGSSHYPAVLL